MKIQNKPFVAPKEIEDQTPAAKTNGGAKGQETNDVTLEKVNEMTSRLSNLDATTQRTETAGVASKSHRNDVGDGVGTQFLGQKVGSSKSSPALMGFNLEVPSKNVFKVLSTKIRDLTTSIEAGGVDPAQAQELYSKLPQASNDEKMALWTPEQKSTRLELNDAIENLARVAPHIEDVAYSLPVLSALQNVNEALFQGNKDQLQDLASEFLKDFPATKLTPWMTKLAAGE